MSGTVPFPWKTNVMGILGDCRVLFASVLCPALSYYATSELFERPPAGVVESCIGGYCLCCGFLLRTRLRQKYNLDGSFLGDFVAHLCCHCVALARIWREAEMQMEAEKQHPQSQVQPLHPPQQNVVQLGPGPQQSVVQLGGPQQIHPPYMMHPFGHQQFLHPGLQQMPSINQIQPVQQMPQMGFVNPYQQRPIYMPQQAIVVQQQPDQQNTIDTNLSSDFESSNHGLTGQETVHSYNRNDSIDPPPSNNDPDPWSMLPALHAASQRPVQPPPVHEAPPEVHHPKRKTSKRRPEAAKITYEEVVAKEMADNISPGPRPLGMSPFSLPTIPTSDDSAPKNMHISERLEKLRPNTATKPGAQVGASFKSVKDNSDLVDEIMLGDTKLVSQISMPKELEVEDPLQSTSHEDPPQHLDRSGSVNTKQDDSSLVTYGATVGSEMHTHTSLHLASIEVKKSKEESA